MPAAEYKRCLQCGKRFKRLRNRSQRQWDSQRFDTPDCAWKWNGAKRKTHGATTHKNRSPEYESWMAMKSRCMNPNATHYEDYGGRGITVCDQWLYSFENFYADMGTRPFGKSLDRINTNGDYEPGNCRWATPLEQARNRRKQQKPIPHGENPSIFPGATP